MEYQPNLSNIKAGNGGVIQAVAPGSTGARLGLQPGDAIVQVNGLTMRDVIDFRFAMTEEQTELVVRQEGVERTFQITKELDDMLGLDFIEPLFDRLRTCNNKCPFCFLTQMPKGFRKTLYLKDDDYRLSFLYGNFVTLTNLNDDDWRRIEEQRLGPMYVSVHATDRTLRAILLGKPDVPDVLGQIRRLGELGIDVHTQVVACPQVNDGAALAQTIHELGQLYPVVQSIAVVPVGLTRYRFEGKKPQTIKAAIRVHETPEWIDTNWERQSIWQEDAPVATELLQAVSEGDLGFCARLGATTDVELRPYRSDEAAAVIDICEPFQGYFTAEHGSVLVYPSDEFYLLAGREQPQGALYEGYDQLENGVGLVRQFQDDWAEIAPTLPRQVDRPTRMLLACGTLAAPVLQPVVERLSQIENLTVQLCPVSNTFFGEMVTVSGLLTGGDVVAELLKHGPADLVMLPKVMFDHGGTRTIDEWTVERIAAELGAPVAIARMPDEIRRVIRQLSRQRATRPRQPTYSVSSRSQ
ncbi:MAG: DUF512 domain-containing protein [Herpetosiphonaceae bacterium]|nr:DUF512 domain-containing protein [Herpetosiphonaceae bacterium]